MKIVTWNCNGALRNKLKEIESLKADVLIIQECEDPARSSLEYKEWAGNYLWLGKDKNKGIGVFTKSENTLEKLNWSGVFGLDRLCSLSKSTSWRTADLEFFLPFRLNNSYTVLACWTKGADSQVFGYMGQFWKYLQIHRVDLHNPHTIIAGDFNSNTIWDKEDRWWNHSDTVNELSAINIESLYHHQMNEKQGQETQPTFFLQRNISKPYHIDYIFVSSDLLSVSHLDIGNENEWLSVSDHMPLSLIIKRH